MLNNGIACKCATLATHISMRHILKLQINFMINSFVLSVCLSLLLFVSVFAFMYRKQQGVSVWAPEEGGSRPGLQDTGGKAHLALIPKELLVCTHIQTKTPQHHIHIYVHTTSRLPSVNRCFLSSSPNHTASHSNTHVQCVPTG